MDSSRVQQRGCERRSRLYFNRSEHNLLKRNSTDRISCCRRKIIGSQTEIICIVTVNTHDKRARACAQKKKHSTGEHAIAVRENIVNVVIRELTAVPGVARRLAHRRRCRPGDGGGGCDGGGQLRRVVGRRCSGAGTGSREKAVAWARVKRTHLSRQRRRHRRILSCQSRRMVHPLVSAVSLRSGEATRRMTALASLRCRRLRTSRKVIGPATVARMRAN